MNLKLLATLSSVLIMTSCLVAPNARGGVDIVPILPAVVELDVNDHYAHGGYHYYYNDDRWYYSQSMGGPRHELQRNHWPRETRRHGYHQ